MPDTTTSATPDLLEPTRDPRLSEKQNDLLDALDRFNDATKRTSEPTREELEKHSHDYLALFNFITLGI